MAAKADSLKDEMDEALNKVEICKVYFVLNLSCNTRFFDLQLKIWFIQPYNALQITVV